MKVELLDYTPLGGWLAGFSAAVCTNSKNYEKALEHALKGGHESVIEHVKYTFMIEGVSRALLAQLTRHRIASFSVQSQRYVNMGDMPVVIPESVANDDALHQEWDELMGNIKHFYHHAVSTGIPKEDARYITPQAACTNLVLSMNARELRHFFSLRCCNRAQWEIRELADKMLGLCKDVCPAIFGDAGPGCIRGNCPEERPCVYPRTKEPLFENIPD